jgi:hypothetical protein
VEEFPHPVAAEGFVHGEGGGGGCCDAGDRGAEVAVQGSGFDYVSTCRLGGGTLEDGLF